MFKKKFVNIQLLTCIRRWVRARALIVDTCQMESIAAEGGTLRGVTMPTILRNTQTYQIYTHYFIQPNLFSLFIIIFVKKGTWSKKNIYTLPIKDNNKSAVFILISVCYVKENCYQACLSVSLIVSKDPPRDSMPSWV